MGAWHGLLAACVSLGACASAPAETSATGTDFGVEVNWSRAQELGLIAQASDGASRATLRDLVDWRLSAEGLALAVEPGVDGLRLLSKNALERDALRSVIESIGLCEFFIVAESSDAGLDLAAEQQRFEAWRGAHSGVPWSVYNADPARTQRRLAWFPTRFADTTGPPMPVWLPAQPSEAFGAADFARVYFSQDAFGYPAVGFEFRAERGESFRAFTQANLNRRMAIVFGSEVRSAPSLNTPLSGGGIIEGKFSEAEVRKLESWLQGRGGPLHLVGPKDATRDSGEPR